MKKYLYLIGVLFVLVFIGISLNYETAAFVSFDEKMSDILFGNKVITAFHYIGDTIFVMVVTLLAIIYFGWKQQDYRAMLFVVLTIAGGTAINQGLKQLFARQRPDILEQLDSFSFPSGHSMLGALYLLTLAYLLGKLAGKTKAKIIYFAVSITLFILIGLSRVAESRHYATDVLGGWSLGIAWFIICVLWYERRERLFKQ